MADPDRNGSNRSVRPAQLQIEEFEPRVVPSATPQTALFTGGLTPSQVRHAYGFDSIAFNGVLGDGRGQTIAIVTANNDPNIASDLAVFDQQFGLPAPPSFTKVAMPGATAVNPTWALETALDVEWAHAMAPGAKILLVEAASGGLGDLTAAADYARQQPGVSVVSMSWGAAEFSVESYMDATFSTPANHASVAFVAASGDGGASGALWPARSPNVLAVGGTQLTVNSSGNYLSESAWSGSAGGTSRYESAPAAQAAVTGNGHRTGPDVSYNAATGYAVYTSVSVNGLTGWMTTGGTSAGTPQWAALLAIADQGRAAAGKANLTNAVSEIYALPASDFHDVTTGSNGAVSAGGGYDAITGRGSPYADRVVNGLVGAVTTTSTPVTTPTPNPTVKTPPSPAVPAPTPTPTPITPPKQSLNFTFIASQVANFVQKATGSAPAPKNEKPSSASAVRLPSGKASFLGEVASVTDIVRALQLVGRRG